MGGKNTYTIKFKHCYRKFNTRKWQFLAQLSELYRARQLQIPFLGVFWGVSLAQVVLPSVNKLKRSGPGEQTSSLKPWAAERDSPCPTASVIYV